MAEQSVGSQDAHSFWSWPVRWAPVVRRAVVRGQPPDVLLDDPQLVAHRILDNLAALAFEARHGAPDAASVFVDAIRKLIGAAPWVVSDTSRRSVNSTADSKNAYDLSDTHLRASVQESVQAFWENALIDEDGVIALLAVAARLAGKDGARAILEVSAAAIAAEQWLPGLSHTSDASYRADIASLGGTFFTSAEQWSAGERASRIAPLSIGAPVWQSLGTLAHTNAAAANKIKCIKLFHELTDNAVPPPQPEGPVSWTTGIDHVEVTDPCGASPLLTIHGQGFGSAAPGVGVVAARWDEGTSAIVYRTVPVMSWSDTQVVVKLGPNAVSGVVAFTDIAFIKIYNLWADGENERVATAMHAAGCLGYGPPASPIIWSHWTEIPAYAPVAAYEVGMPHIVAEITLEPVGKAPALWNKNTVHLETGQTFWVLWKTANADSAVLRGLGLASQVLVAAGYPASGVTGTSGSVKLVAPSQPAVVGFTVEASNAACGTAQLPLRLVVTGPALQPVMIVVQQSLPGGDVDVVPGDIVGSGFTSEAFNPPNGLSIPLVAQKRSVARIDWWTAFPQVPAAEPLTAEASLHVSGPAISWSGVTLRPGTSTANPPPTASDPPVALQSGRPFSSVLEYQQWIAQNINNNPATFNVVLPAELCVGQVTLEATVRVRNQEGQIWTATATRTVTFHQRRRVRIRYRPWGLATNLRPAQPATPTQPAIPAQPANPAPTDQQCEVALRAAGSLLPIPDPEIVRLSGPAFDAGNNDKLIETIWGHRIMLFIAEQTAGKNPDLRDEIWLVVGPQSIEGSQTLPIGQIIPTGVLNFGVPGVGGFAPPWAPWTAATAAWATVTAHEIGHLANQPHLNLCAAGGVTPSSLPNNGSVVAIGWDMWNNVPVRAAIDLMSYCWAQAWMSPERWRRIFLQIGP